MCKYVHLQALCGYSNQHYMQGKLFFVGVWGALNLRSSGQGHGGSVVN